MATSSSDDSCSAPTDFNIFSSLEELNSRSSIIAEKCPLCSQSRRSFYCVDCIRQGDFTHSSSRYPERYAEKKLRLFKIKKERLKTLDRIKESYVHKAHVSQLKSEMRCVRERLTCLRLAIDECKDVVQQTKDEITSLQEQIRNCKTRAPLMTGQLSRMVTYMNKTKKETTSSLRNINEIHSELKTISRRNIEQLVKYIFPISEVRLNKSESDSGTEDTVTALAEATRTTYVHGRWVYADNVCDVQYRIVESYLPASGDYSDYSVWVATNKDAVPGTEVAHKNPAYAISSGLTYTTQLVSILAFYLDINLAQYLCYSDFCGHELSKEKFLQKVAKLNANVMQLCICHSANPEMLHPRQTIRNLLHLLNPENNNLGRPGPFMIGIDQMSSMEDSLASDLNISVSSDDDDDDETDLIGEWEKIHCLPFEEAAVPTRGGMSATTTVHTIARQNAQPQTTASVTGGLVTSAMGAVTSWWKAALGK